VVVRHIKFNLGRRGARILFLRKQGDPPPSIPGARALTPLGANRKRTLPCLRTDTASPPSNPKERPR
jgi:hypothetical protein